MKAVFGSADFLAKNRVVFDIKGNSYRLIAQVKYGPLFVGRDVRRPGVMPSSGAVGPLSKHQRASLTWRLTLSRALGYRWRVSPNGSIQRSGYSMSFVSTPRSLTCQRLLLAAAMFCLPACEPTQSPAVPRRQVPFEQLPPKPEPQTVDVDFGPLFATNFASRSIILAPREPELMRRVLVGPNLVFEASRSSLTEHKTVGPDAPPPTAPTQPDALGSPVDIELSTLLIQYLAKKGSIVLAPAVQRRWGLGDVTWVERALLATARRRDAKDKDGPHAAPDELPTAVLAVRRLGIDSVTVGNVIAEDRAGTLTYRFSQTAGEVSLCPASPFNIPVIAFSAELISLRDGRILARINETQRISAPQNPRVRVEATEPVENPQAVEARRRYAELVQSGYAVPPPTAIPVWLSRDVRCRNADAAFKGLISDISSRANQEAGAAIARLLGELLDSLFDAPKSTPPAKARK